MVLKKDRDQLGRSCEKLECYKESSKRGISYIHERRKGNWIGHILRRNCLIKRAIEEKIEGRIEVKVKRERQRKQVLGDFKKNTGYRN